MLATTWDQLFLDYLPPQVLCPQHPFVPGSRTGSKFGRNFCENELEGSTQVMGYY
jgi:hypothetical protein